MSKVQATKQDPKASRKAEAVSRTAKNKARRLARHVKAHPEDLQSASKVGKPLGVRKAPLKKGAHAPKNRHKMYRDEAGHILGAPAFKASEKADQ
ncbi:hypothetical protein [Vibrio phage JSF12]|uniref:Uncharacterized protein n=3 Tax=Jesfedecavirus TaxID=2560156 RepID=A0A2D0YNF6_9CAUD|nr:hypothetical protein AVV29_gp132 [Vibrio phage phi 3]YP_009618439.1 hypothetical protein FDI98_gp120 [Vibrio phage JSF10]YP_009794700.1 hypothetical protein HOS35_gp017 [Vibrio phage JSF12]AJF40846.1 hypothetical protein SBVP3_0079 [Vibrio phage phi 3]ASV43412.1 hypothetical protein [Vibrio phage JSF10]ASV43535.1 hypothetical protein [Vibrio phage JSF12]